MQRTAIVTGVTGQDGSYLAELLLERGYKVVGVKRRSSTETTERVAHLLDNGCFELVEGDITDAANMYRLISWHRPSEFYNLAAMSHVGTSFDQPLAAFQIDALGVLNILEAIRHHSPQTRFYQASTSELFGDTTEAPQNEETRLNPCSPYAIAKLAAHHLVGLYRKAYGLHASAGILFNHESPRRGEQFVTRKITKYVAGLAAALHSGAATLDSDGRPVNFPMLKLGNLDARRDWGHAKDYVRAMWLMLQKDQPSDYVVATGETHSIREFLNVAFDTVGLHWAPCVVIDDACKRPADVNLLLGDASRARRNLGWRPHTDFYQLVTEMVSADLDNWGLAVPTAREAAQRAWATVAA